MSRNADGSRVALSRFCWDWDGGRWLLRGFIAPVLLLWSTGWPSFLVGAAPPIEGRAVKVYCALCKQWFDGPTHRCPLLEQPFPVPFSDVAWPQAREVENEQALSIANRGVRTWNRGVNAWGRNAFDAAIADMETGLADFRTALMLEPNNASLQRQVESADARLKEFRRYRKLARQYQEAVEKADLDAAIRALEEALKGAPQSEDDGPVGASQVRDLLQTMNTAKAEQAREQQRSQRRIEEMQRTVDALNKALANVAPENAPPSDEVYDFRPPRGDLIGAADRPTDPPAKRLFAKPEAGGPAVDTRVVGPSRLDIDPKLPMPSQAHVLALMRPPFQPYLQIVRELLLKPPVAEALFSLDEPTAILALLSREDARRDEADRLALLEFQAELVAWQRKGLIREGDDLQRKVRDDPEFSKAVSDALQRARGHQQQRLQSIAADSIRVMEQYLRQRRKPSDRALAEIDRLAARLKEVEAYEQVVVRRKALETAEAELQAIAQEGLLDDVRSLDDLARKEASDPTFAERMQHIRTAGEALAAQERSIRAKTYQKLLAEVQRILGDR